MLLSNLNPRAIDAGIQGLQGLQGIQGIPGVNGTNGLNGSAGPEITISSAYRGINSAAPLLISGFGFNPSPGSNSLVLSSGAAGSITAAF